MKKIILNILCCLLVLLVATGCTYRTDYIKKYNDELHMIFGNFTYNYLGEEYDNGLDGLGRHNYKKWEIHFTDLYGTEKNVILVNDKKFDSQINNIYKYFIQRYVTTEILKNCFNTKCYDENTISSKWLNDTYNTKEYNYSINIDFNFGLNNYDSEKEEIKDYNFFSLNNVDIDELINKNIINISNIYYNPLDKKVLSELELKEELDYLIETTKKIDSIIGVKNAYYGLNEEAINYKGESYITITKNELNFK